MATATATAGEEASSSSCTTWSWEQEKAFENALASHPEDCGDRWERVAAEVPGKAAAEVERHYQVLMDDIDGIESGRVELPCYVVSSSDEGSVDESAGAAGGRKGDAKPGKKIAGTKAEQERRKGIAWTEDEHRLFLLGLEKYGKGDWRSISRNFVISRTPTQVASHAQKYFIRLNSMNKDRRRSSIHDITSVDRGDLSASPGPVSGIMNRPSAGSMKPGSQTASQPAMGQPVGPIVSAVGTPVNLPAPGHIVYGTRPPSAGTVVPGTPMNVHPATYPMHHKSSKR